MLSFGYQGQGTVSLASLQQVARGEIGINEVMGHAAIEKEALSRTRYFTSYDLNDQKAYYSKMIQHRYFDPLIDVLVYQMAGGHPEEAIALLNKAGSGAYTLGERTDPRDKTIQVELSHYALFHNGRAIRSEKKLVETFSQLYSYQDIKAALSMSNLLHKFDSHRLQHNNVIFEFDSHGRFIEIRFR